MSSADEHAVTAETDRKDDRRIPARFADDSPLPGAGPIQAFLRFWKRYPIFTGRASRSEFWWWVVVHAVIVTALLVIGRGVDVATGVTAGFWEGQVTEGPAWGVQSVLSGIWGLATIIPGLSLNARRMHDTDHSGWWQLINLVPIFGLVLLHLARGAAERPGRCPLRHGAAPRGRPDQAW